MSTPTRITHLVAGTPWEGSAERTSPVFNPATGEQTGVLDLASTEVVGEVVATAKAAWPEWAEASLARRAKVLFAFRQLLDERKQEIAALITAEHGKVLDDAVGEVNRGLEVAEFACGIPHLLKGGFSENASTSVDVYSMRQPLGVCRRHLALQLPRHGADVVHPHRHRLRERGRPQAEREGPVRRAAPWRGCGKRPVCLTAS